MNQTQAENSNDRPQTWPLPRLIAFATMLLTLATVLIFVVTAIVLTIFKPDLGDQSMLLPTLGALLFSGTLMALLGLVAGLVDLSQSHDRRGVTVLAVVVNGLACLFVFSVTIIGIANS